MPDWFLFDGNFVEFALGAVLVALLVVAILIGRYERLGRKGSLRASNAALAQVIEENQARLSDLRNEKEGFLREALRAQDSLERWEALKRDHENLDVMRTELEAFEREESNRIDELERRRAEAARRLGDVQVQLDAYPPEITRDDAAWSKVLESRKAEIEKLNEASEAARRERAEAVSRRDDNAEEADRLESRKAQLSEDIEKLERRREAAEAALEAMDTATIQFPDQALTVAVKEVPTKTTELDDKLGMFRQTPLCLDGYDSPRADPSEDDMLRGFVDDLEERNLNYHDRIVRAFHTSLKVNDLSPLTVLSGLSGTGKSQLPRAYANFFGIHFLHVPVEPGWDSPQDILGFYDFVAERYRPTDRARALGHFDSEFAEALGIPSDGNWQNRMLIILLDEMNLARTEYYFSEFLSRLEMRGPRSGDKDLLSESKITIDLPYGKDDDPLHLYVPHNVLWVGTLNEDETTQALSDKVLDRANSIRFAPPQPRTLGKHSSLPGESKDRRHGYLRYQRWLEWSPDSDSSNRNNSEINGLLEELAGMMQQAGRGFGYRITQSIKAYIDRYPGSDWQSPMVDQINMRLLPKLSGAEMTDCQDTLIKLRELVNDKLGDEDFARALQEAENHSLSSQIFNWPGYTYEEDQS